MKKERPHLSFCQKAERFQKQVIPYLKIGKLKKDNTALRRKVRELKASARILLEIVLACRNVIPSQKHDFVMKSFIKKGGPEKVKLPSSRS